MLTSARPIFERVPAAFADPVGLADQQARGVVSIVIAHYPGRVAGADAQSAEDSGDDRGADDRHALGPVYDAFVAVSGQILAVARTTPDYRFPVTPATGLARFLAHRDAGAEDDGRGVTLSLYAVSEDDCARFLETVFYQECLKLHVDGADSAALVAAQLARSCCSDGVLEVNDFSDPAAPRVTLVDLAGLDGCGLDNTVSTEIAPSAATRDASAEGDLIQVQESRAPLHALAGLLHGVRGRVLLYDRAKNRAALPGRAGEPFSLDGVLGQAARLADARRDAQTDARAVRTSPPSSDPQAAEAAMPDPAEDALVATLRGAPDAAATDVSLAPHPSAAGLGALVAELQGLRPAPGTLALGVPAYDLDTVEGTSATPPVSSAPPLVVAAPDASPPPPPPAPPPPAAVRHPLASELDRLRAEVFSLFEDAVGRERAAEFEAHVLEAGGFAGPVSPEQTPAYLRALLCDEPHRRWHFFKRARGKTYEEVAGKLLAFHAANGHVDAPVAREALHEVTKLWTRLHA